MSDYAREFGKHVRSLRRNQVGLVLRVVRALLDELDGPVNAGGATDG